MAWTKAKTVAVTAAVALLGTGLITTVVRQKLGPVQHPDFNFAGPVLIEGEVTLDFVGQKTRIIPFQIKTGSNSWQIKTIEKSDVSVVTNITGFDGKDSYNLVCIQQEGKMTEFAWVDEGDFPAQHHGSGQFLWLAFCADNFISHLPRLGNLNTNDFPLFSEFKINDQIYNHKILVNIALDKKTNYSTKEVSFYGYPAFNLSRYLAAKYGVTQTTIYGGMVFPSACQLTRHLPPGYNPPTDEVMSAHVSRISSLGNNQSYLPEIQTADVRVEHDTRLAHTPGMYRSYNLTNKQWLLRSDLQK